MKVRLFTIPNIITLANLACGCAALVFVLGRNDLKTAFYFIAAGAAFDFLDGFAARALKSWSEAGKQLDSLSDVVSFGVAPSAVLYVIYGLSGGAEPWGYTVFMVALFSALRLAKFNVDDSQSAEFRGLPTPACAILIASAGWLFADGRFVIEPFAILLAALLLSGLLISNIRMFALKFKTFGFKKDNAVRYLFILVSVAAVAVFRIAAVPFIIILYILVSTVLHFACSRR